MFQRDGGVKSLTIKQQRDGTESVIWNLARFLKYLIWRTLKKLWSVAKQISHTFENVQLGQLQQRRMVDRPNDGFGELGQFFLLHPLLLAFFFYIWAGWHQLLDVGLLSSSVIFLFKANRSLISASITVSLISEYYHLYLKSNSFVSAKGSDLVSGDTDRWEGGGRVGFCCHRQSHFQRLERRTLWDLSTSGN